MVLAQGSGQLAQRCKAPFTPATCRIKRQLAALAFDLQHSKIDSTFFPRRLKLNMFDFFRSVVFYTLLQHVDGGDGAWHLGAATVSRNYWPRREAL